jgi:subtilisin family serine protease
MSFRRIARVAFGLTIAVYAGGAAAGQPLDFTIYLRNRIIGPDCGIDQQLLDEIRSARSSSTHAIVQLHTLPRMAEEPRVPRAGGDLETLQELGITLLDYLNGMEGQGTAYLASVSRDVHAEDPLFEELVRCLIPLESSDTIEAGFAPKEDTSIFVLFFDDVSMEEARALFAERGLKAEPYARGIWQTTASMDQIEALAGEDPVQWIQAGPPPFMPMADEVREASNVDVVHDLDATSGVYFGLSGAGVQVGIMDTGVDSQHDDFALRIIRALDDQASHGTHVAGVTAGSGERSDKTNDDGIPNNDDGSGNPGEPFQWRGMAPEAEIAAYQQLRGHAPTYGDAINNFGIDVSNHSYGLVEQNEYNVDVASVDAIVRGDSPGVPARPVVWAAANNASVDPRDCDDDGNIDGDFPQYPFPDPPGPCPTAYQAGYFSNLAPCKNCINVASVGDGLVHSRSSSMGPTMDGRLKPEIAAIGEYVFSVAANTDGEGNPVTGNGYASAGGTSISAPAVTGIVALMLEQYAETFAVDLDVSPPLPSTVKAVLIQSAIDLVGTAPFPNFDTGAAASYGPGPDWATGYGLADAQGAVEIIANAGFLEDQLSLFDVTDAFNISVAPGQTELRVTLAWDDRAGNPNASTVTPQLVNDLDLVVVDPMAGIHRPLVLPAVNPRDCDGNPANGIQTGTCPGEDPKAQNYFGPAAEGIDRRNNVEQVVVENPNGLPTGNWTARVSVLNDDGITVRLPFGFSQSYSLVTRLPNREPVAVCSATPVTKPADGACCVEITAAEIDAGSFDPNGDADIDTICFTKVDGSDVACQPSVEICGAGSHSVSLTITDMAGESSSCDAAAEVEDVTSPVIACPSNATLECPADTSPGNTGTATATDNCSISSIDSQDVSVPGCGGTQTITRTWTAVDGSQNAAECSQIVEVVDTTPPDLVCGVGQESLWPPGHKLVDIGLTYDAVDACDPNPPTIAVDVTSDEDPAAELGAGGPKHCPDAVIEPGDTVHLRAERSGGGDGRVYVSEVAAEDDCGNVAVCQTPVTVQKSKGPKHEPAIDSGQTFDAALCGGSP